MKSKAPELCVIGGGAAGLAAGAGLPEGWRSWAGDGFGTASPSGEKAACNGQRSLQSDQPARFSSRLF